ncbi:unnamed protein product [Pleuronectes platessa]|uniref:Uncharacterized protein n=1 Tax=Pleuronectes platessa TaxID=8262 RepID=A0A9N7TIS6_PLEPL|nr:unnamed protein product [Pleuronectes platessa]
MDALTAGAEEKVETVVRQIVNLTKRPSLRLNPLSFSSLCKQNRLQNKNLETNHNHKEPQDLLKSKHDHTLSKYTTPTLVLTVVLLTTAGRLLCGLASGRVREREPLAAFPHQLLGRCLVLRYQISPNQTKTVKLRTDQSSHRLHWTINH